MEILSSPLPTIKVLTGSTVNLLWRFRVGPENKLKFTIWYFVKVEENRRSRNKIIIKEHEEDVIKRHPALGKQKSSRTSCNFSSKKQVIAMHCQIREVNVDDSGDYGIQIEVEGFQDPMLNASSLEVVGKLAIDNVYPNIT